MSMLKAVPAVALTLWAAAAAAQVAPAPAEPAPSQVSAEDAAKLGEQNFAMSLRILGPSGKKVKGTDEEYAKGSVYLSPYGVSENNRYNAFGAELPINNKGTSATGAMMNFHDKNGIETYRYDPFTGGYQKSDLSSRWGIELGVRQSLGRVGYGAKNGKGVYLEPYATAGVTPFAVGSSAENGQTTWVSGAKTMNSPSAFYGVGGKVNLWNVASVGVERRYYTNQTAPDNQTKPYTTVIFGLTQHGIKAIGRLFSDD